MGILCSSAATLTPLPEAPHLDHADTESISDDGHERGVGESETKGDAVVRGTYLIVNGVRTAVEAIMFSERVVTSWLMGSSPKWIYLVLIEQSSSCLLNIYSIQTTRSSDWSTCSHHHKVQTRERRVMDVSVEWSVLLVNDALTLLTFS